MKLTRHYEDATEQERLDQEMCDEIDNISDWIKKYTSNIDSLLGKKRSKKVKKHIIEQLVEQL